VGDKCIDRTNSTSLKKNEVLRSTDISLLLELICLWPEPTLMCYGLLFLLLFMYISIYFCCNKQ